MDELYNEKIRILQEVLRLTESVSFKGIENDADVYIEMIGKRDELFEQAKAIDAQLEAVGANKNPAAATYKRQISELAKRIIEQDNYMKDTVTEILDGARDDVKNIKNGKNLNSAYGNASDVGGSVYDWSQ